MPDILPNRCTHERSPLASCHTCVETCPRTALHHGADSRLTLDVSACDECGLCVAACPEGAITARLSDPLFDSQHKTALWACQPAATSPGNGILPCLHAATDQMLADLARRGICQIKVLHDNCTACARYPRTGQTLEKRLTALNAALQARRLPTLSITHTDAATWQQQASGMQAIASRRGFFGNLLKRPVDVLMTASETGLSGNKASAMGTWLQAQGTGLLPAVPVVDFNRCTLCGACASLCAHQALTIHDLGEKAVFTITPEQCTGCRLCVDICLDQAITIHPWQTPAASPAITLVKRVCKRCKNTFWQLAEDKAIATCCPVCHQSGGKNPNRIIEN